MSKLLLITLLLGAEVLGQTTLTKEYIYLGARVIAVDMPASGPTNLVATAASGTQVNLTWSPVSGTNFYRVERSFNNAAYAEIGTTGTAAYTDNFASAGVTYLYRVRAVDFNNNPSAYSNVDLATTIIFTDDPLITGVTVVKAQHLNELRQAVNAVRASAGLTAASWTDPSLTGVVVKAVHVQELRNALNPALTTMGLIPPTYTDPTLLPGITPMKTVHVEQLRQGVK